MTSQGYEELLREALNQLFDPVYLHGSALVSVFGLQERVNSAQALQDVLVSGIKALKPTDRLPAAGRSQRYYQVLYYRYVQQFTQADVARKLGLSSRHLRREQDAAIHALSNYLCERHSLSQAEVISPARDEPKQAPSGDQVVERLTAVCPVLEQAASLVACLSRQYGVQVEVRPAQDLPLAVIPRTALRSVVLDLLTAAVRAVSGGRVTLSASASAGQVEINLIGNAGESGIHPKWDEVELLPAQQLASQYGGSITLDSHRRNITGRATFEVADEICVLAIEDNEDTLQLWGRYLENTPYRLVGVRDPAKALATASQVNPALIVLDVMMPGIDGWELLGRLQYHPASFGVPVIVCTVHPQRELAMSLGASDFLRKPTARLDFVAALDGQSAAAKPRKRPESSGPDHAKTAPRGA